MQVTSTQHTFPIWTAHPGGEALPSSSQGQVPRMPHLLKSFRLACPQLFTLPCLAYSQKTPVKVSRLSPRPCFCHLTTLALPLWPHVAC